MCSNTQYHAIPSHTSIHGDASAHMNQNALLTPTCCRVHTPDAKRQNLEHVAEYRLEPLSIELI
jgi:hypothetical protein